eukprot:TRINITY_DN21255_c0_g1_i5.p1 TRINITY_DN21255_c0_g1~~TRINITY_DN21255_c0_g1_i5.p1  ORF type:complete len:111 (+),score=23.89 TRINITY_DN21255_c0_g1_i5:89-421(+)
MIRRPPRSTLSSSSAASDVYKRQSETMPATESVTLSTHPCQGYTHWGHTYFTIYPAAPVKPGNVARGTIHVTRKKEDQRRLNVEMDMSIGSGGVMLDDVLNSTHLVFSLD